MAKKNKYQWDVGNEDGDDARPSRSQKKRDSTALQALGQELVKLPLSRLASLPLTADLDEGLRLMARLTDKEGRRRQMQYIGRLMRECDADPIREALERLQQGHSADTAQFHHVERLREALLAADAKEEQRLLSAWPHMADELHALVLKARREGTPHARRELFRKLKSLHEATASEKSEVVETEE